MASVRNLSPLPPAASVAGIASGQEACLVAGETDSEIYITVMPFSVSGPKVSFSDSRTTRYEGGNHVFGFAAGETGFFLLAGHRDKQLSPEEAALAHFPEPFGVNWAERYSPEEARLTILTISFSGELLEETPLKDSFAVQPRGFCRCGDRFLIGGDNFLTFFNTEGEAERVIDTEYKIWAFQPVGSGAAVQLMKDDNRVASFYVDERAELVPIRENDAWLSSSHRDYSGKLLYEADDLYTYDPDTGEQETLLNWLQLTGETFQYPYLCRIAEDCYLYGGNGSAVYLLTTEYKVDARTVIHIAYLEDNSQWNARMLAAKFNLFSTEYRCEATLYEEQQLDLAITVGDCPDVVFFSWCALDTTTSQFLNLTPLLEQSDVISRDSFLPGLVDSLSIGDELHELWYALAVRYWCAQTDCIDPAAGESWEDYCARAEELGDGYTVMHQEYNKSLLLDQFLRSEIHNYIDESHWTCSFDSPSFAELLTICKEVGIDYSPLFDNDDRGAEYEAYMADYVERVPLLWYMLESNCSAFWDITSIVRSPFSDRYASYDETITGSKLCVPARSANVEGAFSFLEYVMSAETQIQDYFEGIPTNREALEYRLENLMSPEDAAKLRLLVDTQPQVITVVKEALIDMIEESAQAYFAGDKSLEETISLIQSKASVYLAEKSPLK